MQFTMPAIMVYVLAILFVLVNITSANFDLHHSYGYQGAGGWPGKELEWWKITNDDPVNRDKIDFNAGWGPSKDVSHDYRGVRCEGKCGYKDVSSAPARECSCLPGQAERPREAGRHTFNSDRC